MVDLRSSDVEFAVNTIRNSSLGQLTSVKWLEYELLPSLGLSEIDPEHYPPYLRDCCGKGIRSFQQPNQFSRYLCHLSRRTIKTYLEIGAWQGGTFIITVEYLSRFNNLHKATALDISIQAPLRRYAEMNDRVSLHEGDSKGSDAKTIINQEWWDLALIDGDHSQDGCFKDYQNLRDNSSTIAFHDVCSDLCPEVTSIWQRLSEIYPRQCVNEFSEQYADVLRSTGHRSMGIGVLDTGLTGHSKNSKIRLCRTYQ